MAEIWKSCRFCGGVIDNKTNQCVECGRVHRGTKMLRIFWIIITAIAVTALWLCICYFSAVNEAKELQLMANGNKHTAAVEQVKKISILNPFSDTIRSEAYRTAQDLYREQNYAIAQEYFDALGDFERSEDYRLLLSCQGYSILVAKVAIDNMDRLKDLIGFEDTAQLLLRHPWTAQEFLKGRWESGSFYFEISDEDGTYTSYFNLPNDCAKEVYTISTKGVYIVNSKEIFRFEIVDKNTIRVFCYKDGGKYTLYRQ